MISKDQNPHSVTASRLVPTKSMLTGARVGRRVSSMFIGSGLFMSGTAGVMFRSLDGFPMVLDVSVIASLPVGGVGYLWGRNGGCVGIQNVDGVGNIIGKQEEHYGEV